MFKPMSVTELCVHVCDTERELRERERERENERQLWTQKYREREKERERIREFSPNIVPLTLHHGFSHHSPK